VDEFMALGRDGQRLATFPGLITALSARDTRPLSSPGLRVSHVQVVIRVPQEKLRMGGGMRQPELFTTAEEAVGGEVVPYSL
jgi:DUF917 family protein